MTTEQTIDIFKWSVPLFASGFWVVYQWVRSIEKTIALNKTESEKVITAHKADNVLCFQEHHLRLKAVEELTAYLVEAGKNLKDQQASMNITVNSIQLAIIEMNKNIEKIIIKLDKYDENITNFYRDFDLKHKQEHKS